MIAVRPFTLRHGPKYLRFCGSGGCFYHQGGSTVSIVLFDGLDLLEKGIVAENIPAFFNNTCEKSTAAWENTASAELPNGQIIYMPPGTLPMVFNFSEEEENSFLVHVPVLSPRLHAALPVAFRNLIKDWNKTVLAQQDGQEDASTAFVKFLDGLTPP